MCGGSTWIGSARLRKACRCGAPARVAVAGLESGIDGIGVGQVFGAGGSPPSAFLSRLQALPEGINQPEVFLADAGCFSERMSRPVTQPPSIL